MFSDKDYDRSAFLQYQVACNIKNKTEIPNIWIPLDSQSAVDVFANRNLLKNIHDAKKPLILHCNAGMMTIAKIFIYYRSIIPSISTK